MFSLHGFVKKTIKGMVGMYPEFQVREYALNWYSKGVLTEEDLTEVELWFTPPVEEDIANEHIYGNDVRSELENEESVEDVGKETIEQVEVEEETISE